MPDTSILMVVIEEDIVQMVVTLARAGATLAEAKAAVNWWLESGTAVS